jgi:hypothetical protein
MNNNRPPFIPPPPWEVVPPPWQQQEIVQDTSGSVKDQATENTDAIETPETPETPKRPLPSIQDDCAHGLDCIKNHMLRAHLYLSEALRFSASQGMSAEVSQKVRQAKEQLLCEDDFQEALTLEGELKYEVMKLLASTRDTWKAIDASGLDMEMGTQEELEELTRAVVALQDKIYEIDRGFRKLADSVKP